MHFHELSAGNENNRIRIPLFEITSKRIFTCALVIGPALLFSSAAQASNSTSSILTYEQCKAIVENGETLKAVSKADKFIKLMRKGSGWYTTGTICTAAVEKSIDSVKNPLTIPQMVIWSSLMFLCGGLTFAHLLED